MPHCGRATSASGDRDVRSRCGQLLARRTGEGAMYGTTMIGTMAEGVSIEDVRSELKAWEAERHPSGYLSNHVLVADDGKTVVNVAVFDSKDSYLALADDPA